MKVKFSSILIIVILAFSQFLIAQKDLKPPKEPTEPKIIFGVSDFQFMSEEETSENHE